MDVSSQQSQHKGCMSYQRCNLPFNSRHKSPGRRIKDFLEYIWGRLGSLISITICYIQILHFQRSTEWHKSLLFLIISTINIYKHHIYNISSKSIDHITSVITREDSKQTPNGASHRKRPKIISEALNSAKIQIQSNTYQC